MKTVSKDLQRIPGVGPSLAQDLIDLGVPSVAALRERDPQELYDRLCQITGERQDPCVLYVFRCAVYFASHTKHEPELLKWWNWTDTKLQPASVAEAASVPSLLLAVPRDWRPSYSSARKTSSGG